MVEATKEKLEEQAGQVTTDAPTQEKGCDPTADRASKKKTRRERIKYLMEEVSAARAVPCWIAWVMVNGNENAAQVSKKSGVKVADVEKIAAVLEEVPRQHMCSLVQHIGTASLYENTTQIVKVVVKELHDKGKANLFKFVHFKIKEMPAVGERKIMRLQWTGVPGERKGDSCNSWNMAMSGHLHEHAQIFDGLLHIRKGNYLQSEGCTYKIKLHAALSSSETISLMRCVML